MKDKEKLFEMLRESIETPQESFAVEEMIRKVESIMPAIETISDTQKKFAGLKFYKNIGKNFCCTISIHRFVWQYFNGEIPEGYDVHHRDFNHDNNDIANLELVTKDKHKKIHTEQKFTRKPKSKFTCVVCGRKCDIIDAVNDKFCSEKCAQSFQPEIRTCAFCGKEFIPSNKTKIYCSANCNKNASRERNLVESTCLFCGKKFLTEKSKGAKFCSRVCAGKAKERKEIRICLHCGEAFSTHTRSKRKFCSNECYFKSLPEREVKTCPICGKIFSSCPSKNQKYCSSECYHIAEIKT